MYDFRTVTFSVGKHDSRNDGMCIMEAAAYIAGEHHSDHPVCVCPVIGKFCRSWNDGITDDARRAELLAPFLWRVVGTRADERIEERRRWMCVDWLWRDAVPRVFRLNTSLVAHADALAGLPELTGEQQLVETQSARNAAWDAAWDAAWYAAGNAAWDAAAWYAAGNAAGNAAWNAAAWYAAGDRLAETVLASQESAAGLLDRMVRLTEPREVVPAGYHQRAKELAG